MPLPAGSVVHSRMPSLPSADKISRVSNACGSGRTEALSKFKGRRVMVSARLGCVFGFR